MQGNKISIHVVSGLISFMSFVLILSLQSQEIAPKTELDKKVEAFLESYEGKWRDMNIPTSDGKLLYDIILKNGYTHSLAISCKN